MKTFIIKGEEYDILYTDQVYNIVIYSSNDEMIWYDVYDVL